MKFHHSVTQNTVHISFNIQMSTFRNLILNSWSTLLLHEKLHQISSSNLNCRVLASLIVLLIISQRFSVGFRPVCWEMKHSDIMVGKPAAGSFGTVGRFKVLLEKESTRRHEVLLNLLADGAVVDSGR